MGHAVVSGNHTWAEGIQRANDTKQTMLSRSAFNPLLLAKDEAGRFKPVPDDILRARPLLSGTSSAIGPKGRKWKTVEANCEVGSKMVEIAFDAKTQQEAEVALSANQGFVDGTPTVGFYDKKGKLVKLYDATGRQVEEMPDRVDLRFNGNVSQEKIQSRDGGVLETFNGETVHSYVADSAVLGLWSRGDDFVDDGRRNAGLLDLPSVRFRVAVEAADAIVAAATMRPLSEGQSRGSTPLATSTGKLELVKHESGIVTLRGSEEGIQELLRVARSQNLL